MSDSKPPVVSDSLSEPLYIVGIGASAGGLQALEEFFANMPANSGAAFVAVQHLSPNFKSLMPELLQRRTKLRTQQVEDGAILKPNTVYLIPPKNNLVLRNRRLHLIEQESRDRQRLNFPVTLFFESLAQECGDRAIGVILSGSGGDGTRGIQAIGEAGGLTFVQSPATAEFDGMPQSAIATGIVDCVASPKELAETLYPILIDPDSRQEWLETRDTSQIEVSQLREILTLLDEFENVDFSHYRPATLKRRILRRFALSDEPTLSDYIKTLRESAEARSQLRDDLLIGVTRFFRDPAAWQALSERVLPSLLGSFPHREQLRVWVTACSTGEEAYSMAIVLDELIARLPHPINLKLFATDIDPIALEKASAGIYPASIAEQVDPVRLKRYFHVRNGEYRIKSSLREQIIFAPHNLIKNAGFSNMHLISCRNVLIYMQPQLQQQVLRVLHFSLASKGVLFLGNAEVLSELDSEFEPIQPEHKIFRKRRDVRLPLLPRTISPPSRQRISPPPSRASTPTDWSTLLGTAFDTLVAERGSTCVLIDSDSRLLHVFCDEANLLRVPKGRVKIETMLPDRLRLPLSTALHRARRERQTVNYTGIRLPSEDGGDRPNDASDNANQTPADSIRLKVTHVPAADADESFIVALEREPRLDRLTDRQDVETNVEATQRILELEQELQQTRENLQATIEELETTNEEQQATNEELLASNEELQSTNEELHSVNEELYTINAEYQSKIQELTELNEDVNNLLQSTEIGVVFLDNDLRIRKFTPAIRMAIDLLKADIGRPLENLSYKFDYPNLIALLEDARDTQQEYEREVRLENGHSLLLRIYPYLRESGDSEGLILSVIDVENLRQAREKIERQKRELEYLYDNLPIGLTLLDENLTYLRINDRLAEMNGHPVEAHLGKTLREMLPELADELEPIYRQVLDEGEPILNLEVEGVTPADPDRLRTWLASYKRIDLSDDRPAVSGVVMEITELKQARRELQRSEAKYRAVVDNVREIVFQTDTQGQLVFLNRRWMTQLGYRIEESLGRSLADYIVEDDRALYDRMFAEVLPTDGAEESYVGATEIVRLQTSAGSFQPMRLRLRRTNGREALPWVFGTLDGVETDA